MRCAASDGPDAMPDARLAVSVAEFVAAGGLSTFRASTVAEVRDSCP